MGFEDVMGAVKQWSDSAQALAALGAQLALLEPGTDGPPEVADALRTVSSAAGLSGLEDVPPQQRAIALALIRTYLHQAVDLLDDPTRAPGWGFTDPVILDGWGRASTMVPTLIAQAHPDLESVSRLLDVGTGVGLLALAATDRWPAATVVGIDPSSAPLARAKEHVEAAGRADRVELRQQDIADVEDNDEFDCAWVPSFFLSVSALETGLPRVFRALRPGGWVVVGCDQPAPTPLAAALSALDCVRNDASEIDPPHAMDLLTRAGCVDVHQAGAGPAPIVLVLGRRPA